MGTEERLQTFGFYRFSLFSASFVIFLRWHGDDGWFCIWWCVLRTREKHSVCEKAHRSCMIPFLLPLKGSNYLLTKSQLANALLMKNYLFFFYHLLPPCSLVTLILPLFFKRIGMSACGTGSRALKGRKMYCCETYLYRY